MKRITNKLFNAAVTVMLAAAVFIVTPTCFGFHYQPEVPKSLRK
ncbi:MAG: cyclic lactone autoinducer peptide [Firmicutes bacterium]|nr:cyclic lactone autoinducer peptide [Bacillota bacterium]